MHLAVFVALLVGYVNANECVVRSYTGSQVLIMSFHPDDSECQNLDLLYSCTYTDSSQPEADAALCTASVILYDTCGPTVRQAEWTYDFLEAQPRPPVKPRLRFSKGQTRIRKGDRITLDVTLHLEPGSTIPGLPEYSRLTVNGVFDTELEGGSSCHENFVVVQPECSRHFDATSITSYIHGPLDLDETQASFGGEAVTVSLGDYWERKGRLQEKTCGKCVS